MKRTNLELVQDILSSMDGDEINSVTDTTESQQVLRLVKTVYYDIAALGELTRDKDIFQLDPSNDTTLPVTMYLPDDAETIEWIKYDYQTDAEPTTIYENVYPMSFVDFVQMVTGFDPGETDVDSYTYTSGTNTFTLYCKNNAPPKFYTTADDRTVLFDSFDNTVDATLQRSKTMCAGQKAFPWEDTDIFVPPLDDKQHQRLLHEAKSLAFAELKQSQHVKAEKTARDIKIEQQRSKTKIPLQSDYDRIPNMGRRGPVGRVKPTGRY